MASALTKYRALFLHFVQVLQNKWIVEESVALCKLSLPMVLTLFLEYLTIWMSLIFIGHLPKGNNVSLAYSAAGLGASFVNMTGLAISDGLSSAADTLCSQAYGYKSYKRVGIILQRGILIVLLGLFPVWAVWVNTEPVLLLLQQPPCVARFAAEYVFIFSLSLPAYTVYSLLRYYLQAQGIVWQLVWIGLISNVASFILHIVFIFVLDLGYAGAVWAMTLSNIVMVGCVLIYMRVREQDPVTWSGWGFECLYEWTQYIQLAVPGLILLFLDWFTIEIINLVAGWLGEKHLAANTVMTQTTFILSILAVGISSAVSVRVGNSLGAGKPLEARKSTIASVFIGVTVGAVYVLLLLWAKDTVTDLYVAGDEEVRRIVQEILPAATTFIFFEQIQLVLCGVIHGCGKQNVGAVVIFICDYIFGIPFGMILVKKTSMGIKGLWIGMLMGVIIQLSILTWILVTINWNELSAEAISKIEADVVETDYIEKDSSLHNGLKNGAVSFRNEPLDADFVKPSYQDRKRKRNPSLWERLRGDSSSNSQLRFRLGMCVSLYAVGILTVVVAYSIHWLRESHRTNLDCVI